MFMHGTLFIEFITSKSLVDKEDSFWPKRYHNGKIFSIEGYSLSHEHVHGNFLP